MGHLLTEDKMAPVVRNLFEIRTQSYFDPNIVSLGILPTICEVLQKYDLFNYFDTWFSDSVFPTYLSWKAIVKTNIWEFEENAWIDFVQKHPSSKFARTCLDNVSPHKFWSIYNQYPDLVLSTFKLDCWVILGLVPCCPGQAKLTMLFVLFAKNPTIIFITSFLIVLISVTILIHFGQILVIKATKCNSADGSHVSSFLTNLDQHNKALMLVGCLPLPFDSDVT